MMHLQFGRNMTITTEKHRPAIKCTTPLSNYYCSIPFNQILCTEQPSFDKCFVDIGQHSDWNRAASSHQQTFFPNNLDNMTLIIDGKACSASSKLSQCRYTAKSDRSALRSPDHHNAAAVAFVVICGIALLALVLVFSLRIAVIIAKRWYPIWKVICGYRNYQHSSSPISVSSQSTLPFYTPKKVHGYTADNDLIDLQAQRTLAP